jgi:hypothetical protein
MKKSLVILATCLSVILALVACGGSSGSKQTTVKSTEVATPEPVASGPQPWKVVGSQGQGQFVFVEAEKVHDRVLMAQILQAIVGQKSKVTKPVQIMFFNKESETPRAFPMTDSQMLHEVAQYNYNPNNGYEDFVWITIANSKSSPPEQDTKTDDISPGIAR